MKKLVLSLALILAALILPAQTLMEYKLPVPKDKKCEGQSYYLKEKNGITASFFQNINFDKRENMNREIKLDKPLTSLDTIKKMNGEDSPGYRLTHHLKLNFDLYVSDIIMTSSNSSYDGAYFQWSGQNHNVAEVDAKEGSYDIAIFAWNLSENESMNVTEDQYIVVLLNDLNLFTDIDTTIDLNVLASHYIYFHGMDENHLPMIPSDTTLLTNNKMVSIEFPLSVVFQSATVQFNQYPLDYIRISDFSSDYLLGFGQSNVRQGKMFVLDLGHFNGITEDVILVGDPDNYKRMSSVFYESPSAVDDLFYFGSGVLCRSRNGYPYFNAHNIQEIPCSDYIVHDKDTVQVYLSNTFNPENLINFVGSITFLEDSISNNQPKAIYPPPFYLISGDSIPFSWHYPPTKADYIIPNNSITSFGNSCPFANIYSVNNPAYIYNLSTLYGQSNETRFLDKYTSLYTIIQGTDTLQSGRISEFTQPFFVSNSGSYSYNICDSNFFIEGYRGVLQVATTFNLSNGDPNPPVLTSFKLINADGFISSAFQYDENGFVHFSATDYINGGIQDVESVQLYYKKHNAEGWNLASVQETPEFYDPVFRYGEYFIGDITPALAQFTVSGYLDLKLIITDIAGNTTTHSWYPGVYVEVNRPWNYTVTGLAHTISVPNIANPNIYGQPLEPGDWVGVFYTDDNGNEACGGAAKIDAQGNAVVMAYGDDPTTEAKDGFENGEVFRWKLYDASSQTSYDATATYDINMPNQGNFANLGLSKLTGIASQWCQDYTLAEGWNSLSSYIAPTDPAVENIFAPVVDNLTILQNLTSVYWPAEGINTIGNFNNNSGYAIKVVQGTEMSICGPSYASKVLPVSSGWHYMPVLSQCPVGTMDFFGSYLDDIVIVQDLIGDQVFWPEMNIYTLETLQPGRAYKIKVNDDITFTFPECDTNQTKQKSARSNTISTPWGTINMTPSTQVTALLTEAMDEIQVGDEIGTFGVDGTLFGYMTVLQTNQNQVVVLFGDDTITDTVDGFSEGETVRFKLYRPSTGKEYDLIPTYSQQLSNPTGNYYSSSFAAIQDATLVQVGTEELRSENIRIYPNPAKDVINIQVPANISSVKLLNPLGVVVHSEKVVGKKTVRVNTEALGAGSYILQVTANDGTTINRKVVITK
jgi:hypothetical protein